MGDESPDSIGFLLGDLEPDVNENDLIDDEANEDSESHKDIEMAA